MTKETTTGNSLLGIPEPRPKPDYSSIYMSEMAWAQMNLTAKWEGTDLARHAIERERKKSPARYKVLIDDNFHYQDEEHRYEHDRFGTADEAVAACKRIVDECLTHMLKPGMTAEALYEQYVTFGEDPYVMPVDPTDARVTFSAWNYAKERCEVLELAPPIAP